MSTIFLWEAGRCSGTSGSLEGAQEEAAGRIAAGDTGLVEEASITLTPGRSGGLVSEHVRTGRAWLGSMTGSALSWRQADGARL